MCKYSKLKDCESWWIWNCRCFSIEYNCNCRKELVPWCNRTVDNLKNGWISQEQLFSIIENSLQAILDWGKWQGFPSCNLKNSSEENSPEFQGQSIFLLSNLLLRLKVKELSPCTNLFAVFVQKFKMFAKVFRKKTEIQPDTEYFILKHSHFCQEEYLKPFLSIKNTFAKENLKILMILLPRYS